MDRKIKIRLSILMLAFIFSGCQTKSEGESSLVGKWRSVSGTSTGFSLTFDKDNSFTTDVNAKSIQFISNGRYRVKGDTLFIRDTLNKPVMICNYIDTGTYIFSEKNDTMFFKTVNDYCEKRRLAFDIGLIRIR